MDQVDLFRTGDLAVRDARGFASTTLVVTFDCYTFNPTLDRQGFGEGFFRGRGIDALHVISRENRWYQHDEIVEALAMIRDLGARYDQIVTYGSSMGGYAAIRHAAAVGASTAIAVAPQYSIDRHRAPFDTRWSESRWIAFDQEGGRPIDPVARSIVFYDPRVPEDRRHVEFIEQDTPVTHVRIPYAGHSAGLYLSELALMAESVVDIVAGRFDPVQVERSIRLRRREVGKYFDNLAALSAPRRPALAVALARRAVEVRSDNDLYRSNLADLLRTIGALDEAEHLQRQALERHPDNIQFLKRLLQIQLARNDLDGALETCGRTLRVAPREADIFYFMAQALAQKNDPHGAIAAVTQALAIDPHHVWYQESLARYQGMIETGPAS